MGKIEVKNDARWEQDGRSMGARLTVALRLMHARRRASHFRRPPSAIDRFPAPGTSVCTHAPPPTSALLIMYALTTSMHPSPLLVRPVNVSRWSSGSPLAASVAETGACATSEPAAF
jgi:hypothetical protein